MKYETTLFDEVLGWACPRCSVEDPRECRTRAGKQRRWPHIARIVLVLAYEVFLVLARRLPYAARTQTLLEVTTHDWLGPAVRWGQATIGEDVSPWERQNTALVAAGNLLDRASDVIERAETDEVTATGELRTRIQALAGDIGSAAMLCRRISLDGNAAGCAGLTPEQLAEELAARDLADYDATLRARLPQPDTSMRLRVSYRDGQVRAPLGVPGAGGFTGYAPTPGAALDLVATATFPETPTLELDPPDPPFRRPATYNGQEQADLNGRNDRFDALLDPALPQMNDHLTACRARQTELAGLNVGEYLQRRADEVNAHSPQLNVRLDFLIYLDAESTEPVLNSGACHGIGRTLQWVPSHLVVRTERTLRWNDFADAHPETVPKLTRALRDASDLIAFTRELFSTGPVSLHHIPGPAGPLYTLTVDGTHRTHLARLLNLPYLLADVTVHSLPRTFDLLTMITEDPAGRPADASTNELLKDRYDLWHGLQRRGLIDVEPGADRHWSTTQLRPRRLPALWWLCSPREATRVNAHYERLYPGTLAAHGIPIEAGTDPDAWTVWLTR